MILTEIWWNKFSEFTFFVNKFSYFTTGPIVVIFQKYGSSFSKIQTGSIYTMEVFSGFLTR
eukprot:TRINITY_DN8652_c0_g1_i1.p1 TRINITY_DN8652_c0_g1~~TRINITY_DN8652_c0_g1_i1.p1  ORF type:complete len:61 (-),score=4.45 TRINITY_DN8652_c0_g1_i1:84-266(-)